MTDPKQRHRFTLSAERLDVEATTAACYDSLTDDEVEENRIWGEFTAMSLADQ